MLQVERAGAEEFDQVLEILVGAARWLHENGIQQWGHYLDPAELAEAQAELRQAIADGEVYLLRQDGKVVGTISLQRGQSDWDRAIWGKRPEDAVYVHRLAIDRRFAGAGLGGAMLDWAEAAGRSAGKRYLRLDCVGGNQRLNQYYAGRYRWSGQTSHIGMEFNRYEKEL